MSLLIPIPSVAIAGGMMLVEEQLAAQRKELDALAATPGEPYETKRAEYHAAVSAHAPIRLMMLLADNPQVHGPFNGSEAGELNNMAAHMIAGEPWYGERLTRDGLKERIKANYKSQLTWLALDGKPNQAAVNMVLELERQNWCYIALLVMSKPDPRRAPILPKPAPGE